MQFHYMNIWPCLITRTMKYTIVVHPSLFIITIYTVLILSDPEVEMILKLGRLRMGVNEI